MKTKTLKQTVTFDAAPQQVYEILMDSKKHAAFTGAPAKITNKVGTKFTAYGDYIEGKNLELKEGKKIVQKWRGSEWPKENFSTATFVLEKSGSGTKLTFTQEGIPEDSYVMVRDGWKKHYWDKMKKMLKK